MFPFGSGMPNPNQYPPSPNKPQAPSAPYVSSSQNHPNRVQMPMPFGSGLPMNIGFVPPPNQSSFNQYQNYPGAVQSPNNSGYPIQQSQAPYQTQSGYPQQNYPGNQNHAGYPAQNYLNVQSPYPNQQNQTIPTAQASYPPQQNAFQSSQSPYPPNPGYSAPYQMNQKQTALPQRNLYPNVNQVPGPNAYANQRGHYDNRYSAAYHFLRKGTPTVLPFPKFAPVEDAAVLRKAMKGFGTDEDALINVICSRSNTQRQEIVKSYKTHYGKDLIEDIKSETRGHFEDILVALLTPIVDFYCKELHDGIAGLGTDEDALIEVLCTLSNFEIETIKNRYRQMYKTDLESDLVGDTSGHFKRLLVSVCNAGRDESGETDVEAARTDATELLRAGELRAGTDESAFNRILCQRNFHQLRLVCQEYEKMCGHSLEKAIESEFSGDIKDGLIAIIQVVMDKHEFFARRLHKSMHGLGTNDRQLIRLVVTRCEIDMHEIKVAFEKLFGKSLKSYIKGDTSGDYKHALYALTGEQRS